MTSADVAELIRDDMKALHDARVVSHVASLLVSPPRRLQLGWVYGSAGEEYEGFLVLNHPRSSTAIVYCQYGFGPEAPWGMIFNDRGSPPSMDMSDGWFPRFMDTYFQSQAATDLAIWRVKERKPGQGSTWLSCELPCDEAWRRVIERRQAAPDCYYDCEHAIMY